MTSQTLLSRRIDRESSYFLRMPGARAVAILTFDFRMGGASVQPPDISSVAIRTVFTALVLDREVLPLLHITEAMIVIGKTRPVNTEVVRN
jgi:hypothetical protein